jgi:hypothetical protein
MKIERQLKQTTTVPKTAMSDIDNDWNDFLMIRGCNWESSAEDDANKCGKKKKNNGSNCSNGNNESNCSNDKNNETYKKYNNANNTNNTNNGNGGNGSGDSESDEVQQQQKLLHSDDDANDSNKQIPVCSPIYISTKTKI